MASLTKLRRRALRWRRYEARAYGPCSLAIHKGAHRVLKRLMDEEERRFWDETPEIWLGGPEGEAALIADVLGDGPECTPYFCPASGETECCPKHSGWDVCCGKPELHRPIETVDAGGVL